mgnify:CR=1 FL=1
MRNILVNNGKGNKIEFYDKERIKEFALKHGFVSNKESEDYIYSQFLSLDINKNSIYSFIKCY